MSPLARRILLGTGFGVLVYAALAVHGGAREWAEALGRWRWSLLAPVLGLALANYLIRFGKWHYYLRVLGLRVPAGESLCVFLSGFVLTVTPGKLGEVIKSYLLRESRGIPMARTAPIVIAERLTDLVSLVLLMLVGLFSFRSRAAWITAAAGVLSVLVCLVVVSSRRLGLGLVRLVARLPVARRHAGKVEELYESMAALVRPGPLAAATLLSVVAWAAECLGYWLVIGGFGGAHASLQLATFIYATQTVAGALSFLPGGLGVSEGVMTALLQREGRGVTADVASAATFVIRLCTLWFAVLVGFVALVVYRRRTGLALDARALAQAHRAGGGAPPR